MKKNGFSYMRRWLWIYLFLVILTTSITFLLVYQEIASTLTKHAAETTTIVPPNHADKTSTDSRWAALQLRVLLLQTAGLFVIGVVGLLWIRMATRHLNRPVRLIQHAISRLAAGKLNETVVIDTPDEYGQIGSGINELAANLQELLLFIWKQTGECDHLLNEILKSSVQSDDHRSN
jgi:methyl-accepting chemotaxis protein